MTQQSTRPSYYRTTCPECGRKVGVTAGRINAHFLKASAVTANGVTCAASARVLFTPEEQA